MTLSPALRLAFAATLAVILGTSVISYQNARALFEESQRVAHTYEVRGMLSELLSGFEDAETGERGFLITGEESFLAPYAAAQREVPERLSRLRDLVADSV